MMTDSKEPSLVDLAANHMQGNKEFVNPAVESGKPSSAPPGDVQSIPNVPQDNEDMKVLEGLLSKVKNKVGFTTITLPSNGFAYNGLKEVQIRPFTWEEELSLKTTNEEEADDVINAIFNSCVEGIDTGYLTIPDRDFILYNIRRITYGNKYPMESACTNPKCGRINKIVLELDKLPIKYASEDLGVLEIYLPDSELDCKVRRPAVKDENHIKGIRSSYENLYRFVLDIDGVTDSKIISEFLKRTTAKDLNTIYDSVYGADYGMEEEVLYTCAGCQKDNKLYLGLTPDFFTPS